MKKIDIFFHLRKYMMFQSSVEDAAAALNFEFLFHKNSLVVLPFPLETSRYALVAKSLRCETAFFAMKKLEAFFIAKNI